MKVPCNVEHSDGAGQSADLLYFAPVNTSVAPPTAPPPAPRRSLHGTNGAVRLIAALSPQALCIARCRCQRSGRSGEPARSTSALGRAPHRRGVTGKTKSEVSQACRIRSCSVPRNRCPGLRVVSTQVCVTVSVALSVGRFYAAAHGETVSSGKKRAAPQPGHCPGLRVPRAVRAPLPGAFSLPKDAPPREGRPQGGR